ARQRVDSLSARLVHPGRRVEQHYQRLDELLGRLEPALRRTLAIKHTRLTAAQTALASVTPSRRIALAASRLDGVGRRLRGAMPLLLTRLKARVTTAEQTLRAVSPLATLARGYAIVSRADGQIVRDAAEVQPDEPLNARLSRGTLSLRVESQRPAAPDEPPA
ncbi:MAG: exodeoxyribonuclease VII large subunit, partial [Betaproteobacteria bacterium]|nr:exodeoxyribonuclease VII large subunit [Betaproteobacteria bacterium]